jgi:hypothetical protein
MEPISRMEVTSMADLTEAEILALAKAANVTIPPSLLPEVAYSLNGLLEALDNIEVPGLGMVEPLPIIIPPPPMSRS